MIISDRDRKIIESLEYDPNLKPSFDIMKSCLVWEDERPFNVTPDGYSLIGDLWIARSFIHLDIPRKDWGLNPDYSVKLLEECKRITLKWPGFLRFEISHEDKQYLMDMKAGLSDYRNYL